LSRHNIAGPHSCPGTTPTIADTATGAAAPRVPPPTATATTPGRPTQGDRAPHAHNNDNITTWPRRGVHRRKLQATRSRRQRWQEGGTPTQPCALPTTTMAVLAAASEGALPTQAPPGRTPTAAADGWRPVRQSKPSPASTLAVTATVSASTPVITFLCICRYCIFCNKWIFLYFVSCVTI